MSAVPSRHPDEDRLFALAGAEAARTNRALFRELNPGLDYAPIVTDPNAPPRPASVLIPVLNRPEGHSVLFTVRSSSMPSHPGEISFPGGKSHPEDTCAVGTALRETHEEVGIPADAVEVVATLGTHLGGRGYLVTPVVGLVRQPPEICACDREVAETFEVPLSHLVNLDNHIVFDRNFGGGSYRMFAVPYDDSGTERFIWGLTAGMLNTLALAWNGRAVGA